MPWTLVVIAAVIGLVAALNVWVKRQALSTDNWTNASSQLLENDQIRSALSVYIVNQAFTNADVSQRSSSACRRSSTRLAPALAVALQQGATRTLDNLLARPRVQELWREANRRAHERFIALLNGNDSALESTNGNVVLDLKPIVRRLADELGVGGRLEGRLPENAGQIVIMKGNQLETARKGVKVIKVLSYFLFFLVIALYAAAIYLARRAPQAADGRRGQRARRRPARARGAPLRGQLPRRRADREPRAKGAVERGLGDRDPALLRNVGINAVIYGIVIIFAAWIAGPSRPATMGAARASRRPCATIRSSIYGLVSLVLFLVLLAGPTDAQRIFPLLILFAFAYAGTEVLRRQTIREFPAEEPQQLPAT